MHHFKGMQRKKEQYYAECTMLKEIFKTFGLRNLRMPELYQENGGNSLSELRFKNYLSSHKW